jgi:hypothetical protein
MSGSLAFFDSVLRSNQLPEEGEVGWTETSGWLADLHSLPLVLRTHVGSLVLMFNTREECCLGASGHNVAVRYFPKEGES